MITREYHDYCVDQLHSTSPLSPRATSASPASSPRPLLKPIAQEDIPGETEEDGMLRREYVLVDDAPAVEVHRTVDGKLHVSSLETQVFNSYTEIHANRKRPLIERKLNASPQDRASPAGFPSFDSPEGPAPISFPPPPNPNLPPLSGSPSSVGSRTGSNPLTRALNLASKKLFGATSSARTPPYYRESASPRRQHIITSRNGLGLDVDGVRDPLEDTLLENLEELAQKTDVLSHWADEMYEYVKAIPQSESPYLLRHIFQ